MRPRIARVPLHHRHRRLGERPVEKRVDGRERVRRDRDGARLGASTADRAACAREVARERRAGAAFGAALRVRLVAGEPEELELEGECERVLRGPRGRGSSTSQSRNRVTASKARAFASCSGKRRSIASAPTSPTESR